MSTNPTRATTALATAMLTLAFAPSASGGDDPHRRLGDHPAVVVQRLHKSAGYDYASKFYPHPAWLRLYAQPPRDVADDPGWPAPVPTSTRRLRPALQEQSIARMGRSPD